ncbi:hypothetical protein [Arthrobacter sp. ES3-54]|uniref:hypothetical protein n=1 Tax=Arthrobacter sp. ES3-54 TaxID=1502991 RepID=UPI0024064A6D|nr:hypothetical protein [Arthrobacter sp. ES3-54]MDF9751550.1 hypothetical protein [Arthrobacter sp. ES3-54]
MTISVGELFSEAGLSPAGVVRWGDRIPLDLPGVYVVASTSDLGDPVGLVGAYRHDPRALDALMEICPSVTVDGRPASSHDLAERIGGFWIPETSVLYVGLAGTSVQKRVDQYYGTRIGQRSPHAGGWWMKTLVNLEALFVHYAAAETPESAEADLLKSFAEAVPPSARQALHDSERIAPFANVAVKPGLRKRHGMAGYTLQQARSQPDPATSFRALGSAPASSAFAGPVSPDADVVGHGTRIESQVITKNDRAGSNLRIPARSKFALPAGDGFLYVKYRDEVVEARWRVNGTRSGTIGLGRTIMSALGTPDRSIWMRVDGTSVMIEV